jgi:hypothetical protein
VAVPQQTPLAVTSAPPSFEIEPPLVIEFTVIFVAGLVVRIGKDGSFLQLLINANMQIIVNADNNNLSLFMFFSFNLKYMSI